MLSPPARRIRATLSTALLTLAVAAPSDAAPSGVAAAVQLDYSANWATQHSGGPTLLVGPGFFGSPVGLGDSIRLCYSIDVTQGGRNETNAGFELSWAYYSQAFGANNAIPGVDLGPQIYHSQVSNDLADDSCFSAFFAQAGTLYQQTAGFLLPGLIAGTGGLSASQGFYWDIAFQFVGPLPQGANTLGTDPANPFGAPLLAHFLFEVQGPVNSGPFNVQYFIASTSERPGLSSTAPGGVTNGNSVFGSNLFGAPPQTSGAIAASRFTAGTPGGPLTGGTLFVNSPGDVEFFGGVAFSTPLLSGVSAGHTGNDGSDWNLSGSVALPATVDVRVLDHYSGAQATPTGVLYQPGLVVNNPFLLFSSTPALSMLQSPLSWSDLSGTAAPKAGSYLLPLQPATRYSDNNGGLSGGTPLGQQSIHVSFDATSSAFLSAGIALMAPFSQTGAPPAGFLFDLGIGTGLARSSQLPTPIAIAAPTPSITGLRVGMHAVLLQYDPTVSPALEVAELTNARTIIIW